MKKLKTIVCCCTLVLRNFKFFAHNKYSNITLFVLDIEIEIKLKKTFFFSNETI